MPRSENKQPWKHRPAQQALQLKKQPVGEFTRDLLEVIQGTHSSRSVLRQLLVVGAVALAIRLVYLNGLSGTLPFSTLIIDGRGYDQWARHIASGNWLGAEVFYQAPLYPYLLAILYTIFGHGLMMVRLVQAVFGVASCLLITHCSNRLFGHNAGWIAGLMLTFYPAAIFFDGIVQKASLDLLLVCTLLWLIVESQRRRYWPWIVATGACLAALTLNRENARIAFPLLFVWIVVQFTDRTIKQRLAWAGMFSVAAVLFLLPVGLRNHYVGNEFLLTTSQIGPNFYIGNHAGANGTYQPLLAGRGDPKYERLDAERLAEQAVGRALSPSEVSRYWLRQSTEFIFSQPVEWAKLMGWKALLTVNAIEVVDSDSIDLYADYSFLLRWLYRFWHFGILMPLAVWGAWVTRHQWRELWIFYGMFLLLAASTALFFVFARYRYPLVPIAILFASAGLSNIPDRLLAIRSSGQLPVWFPGAVITLIVAVVCNWPLAGMRDVARNYSNLGNGLLDDSKHHEALEAYDLAIRHQPQFADAYYNKGVTLDALERRQEALPMYEKAIELNQELGDAHSRLAQYHVDCGNFEKASHHFRQAIAYVAEPALLHFEYGQLLVGQGDVVGAISQYRAALKLDPNLVMATNNLAWLLATDARPEVRSGTEALSLAESNIRKVTENADPTLDNGLMIGLLDTLSAAYAAVGRFGDAIETVHKAITLAAQKGDADLLESLKERLTQYQSGKAVTIP